MQQTEGTGCSCDHAGTQNVCSDIMKALLKPQGLPWGWSCCSIRDSCLGKWNVPVGAGVPSVGRLLETVSSAANPCLSVNVAITLLSCAQLIQSPVTTPLGLIMLKTTSEELACPREDLSVARKEELRKLLLDQVQTVLGLLTGTSHTCHPPATGTSVPLSTQRCCWAGTPGAQGSKMGMIVPPRCTWKAQLCPAEFGST